MKSLPLILSLSVLPLIPPKPADFGGTRYKADFISAHDGDSLVLDRQDRVTIRIEGIDSPELTTNAHGKADPGPAKASRDYLSGLLQGKTIYVEETGKSFERTVARLWIQGVDGRLVSVAWLMTQAGAAKPYP